MTLRGFLAKRIIYTIILVFFVIFINFMIFEAMPGQSGVLYAALGQHSQNQNQAYQHLVQEYDLNASIQDRFVVYVRNLLTFNFGYSYEYNTPVITQMIDSGRLMNTVLLIGSSTVLSIIIGVFIGVLISKRRGTSVDNFWVTSSLIVFSLPSFFVGI